MHYSTETIQRLKRIQSLLDQLNPDTEPQALLVPGSPAPQANVVVFPGSFNPPTNAHIALLQQARKTVGEPAHLYAAISKRTVDKESVERPTWLDRIELLHIVLHRYLRDTGIILFNRGLYVEQAEALQSSFPSIQRIFFLVGFDKIVQIFDPHYYKDRDASLVALFAHAELLVAPRGNDGEKELEALLHRPENCRFAHYVHPLPLDAQYRDISSTRIRQGNAAHDVPHEVQQFIRETHVYEPPLQQPNGTVVDAYEDYVEEIHRLLGM